MSQDAVFIFMCNMMKMYGLPSRRECDHGIGFMKHVIFLCKFRENYSLQSWLLLRYEQISHPYSNPSWNQGRLSSFIGDARLPREKAILLAEALTRGGSCMHTAPSVIVSIAVYLTQGGSWIDRRGSPSLGRPVLLCSKVKTYIFYVVVLHHFATSPWIVRICKAYLDLHFS